ncbi:MAG: beta-ketoacyl-[acyl-carrier-protein] synthase II, partial [Chloroflexales bacterium]|nr:beta-ketoacyl-[acyl-carrier-protein] synthase II [Chloroflexales bacterium]
MAQITASRRAALRAELLGLLGNFEAYNLGARIDELLADVLEDTPITATLPLEQDVEDEDRRVVVTGVGVVSPFGVGVEPFWEGLSTGRSAISRITYFDPSPYPCQIAGQIPGFEPQAFMDFKEARRMSRSSQLAVAAARMAVEAADLRIDAGTSEEIGTLVGCGTISMPDVEQAVTTLVQRGGMKISPFFIPAAIPHMPAAQVAIQLGLRGYISATSTACAAGAQAIGEAAEV